MQNRSNWWLVTATVVATAMATLAVLEYVHRHPASRPSWWRWRTATSQDESTPRLQIQGITASDSSRSAWISAEPPAAVPPDVLQQGLRELRLLDQCASSPMSADASEPSVVGVDDFLPEKIPVPPRCLSGNEGASEERPTIPDGRTLLPVVSVEVLPVAPNPLSPSETPEDLDSDTAEPPGQADAERCRQTQPEDARTDDSADPTPAPQEDAEEPGDSYSFAAPFSLGQLAVVGVGNAPCQAEVASIADILRCVVKLVGWVCDCGPASTNDCRSYRSASVEPEACTRCCRSGQSSTASGRQSAEALQPTQAAPAVCANKCERGGDRSVSQRPAQPKLIRRVYPVAELVESPEDSTDLENLIAEILDCECPYTRQGLVRYYNGTRCLVVMETSDNHARIVALLNELRQAAREQWQSVGARAAPPVPASPGKHPQPCPAGELERVLVVPIVRPVLVPVAVPVPVGVPDTELPPPPFRVPDSGSGEEECPECPAQRLAPPTTPEQLPDCPCDPAELLPALRRFFEPLRGAVPETEPDRDLRRCPETPPVFPGQDDNGEEPCPPEDCEDIQPLETDLYPPIG